LREFLERSIRSVLKERIGNARGLSGNSVVNTEEKRRATIGMVSRVQRKLEPQHPIETLNFWFMNNDNRFHRVNSTNIKYIRTLLGWTQAELGRRSGYSERLIRKAESGGTLKLSTIRDISEAMTAAGVPITVLQLTLDYLTLVREFIEAYDANGAEAVQHCDAIFTEDIELRCTADSTKVSFAGTWQQIEGLKKFFVLYFEVFTRRPSSLTPTYFTSGESVIARFDDTLYHQGHRLPTVRFNLHFAFRDGLISHIEYEFNHHQACQDLEQLRNRLSQKGQE
jgi:transcriptional regulator with XRE-family HTH domain